MFKRLFTSGKTSKIGLLLVVFVTTLQSISAQQLKLKDFAIWGGSAPSTSLNKKQGVSIASRVNVTGNVGSNHMIEIKKEFTLKGNLFTGNTLSLGKGNEVTGNITVGNKAGNRRDPIFLADKSSNIKGNVTANGKVEILLGPKKDSSSVSGKVSVPAPTASYYSGPVPKQGFSNVISVPLSPVMPNNTPFDNNIGTLNITTTRVLNPGSYKNMNLAAGQTITFNGPGNYIFNNIENDEKESTLVFDFKGTTVGTINIFIVKDANWGKMSVKFVNGNFPERIYTEVHGNGSGNEGIAFEVSGAKRRSNPYLTWAGTVWAPNGMINIGRIKNNCFEDDVNIAGALWSNAMVKTAANLTLAYLASVVEPIFINPYYPPPATGKVDVPNNKIGSELFSLATNAPLVSIIPDNTTFRIQGDKVFIEVIGVNANDINLRNELIALGMTGIVNNGPYTKIISGYFLISKLTQLNTKTNIQYVRPLYPPLNNATGQAITQGDTAMRADKVRDRFAVDGEGVKVGVLSDSYNSRGGAPADVTEGDLPNDVQVALDYTGNDEGRAMLQIVHDIAPKAKLVFRTGFQTAGDFAQGITDLSSQSLQGGKCDVIVDDITYITEPFLRDGKVAEAVNNAVTAGVTYFSSAGNFGSKSYESAFQDAGPNTALIPAPATLHRFGATNADTYQRLKLNPGSYTIVLQWSDEFFSAGVTNSGVQTDLDLYLVGTSGYTLFGFNRSNIFGDPFEVCPFTVTDTTEARLIVVKASGSATNLRFKYIIFRGDGSIFDYENTAPSTIVGHPNADSCIAVGAMLYGKILPFTPIYPGVASFSSRGGSATLVRGSTTQFTPRLKPDLIAPNGVNTTVTLGAQPAGFNDGDPYPNFFGTSAAAPHAAGVAALLIHARKKFDLQTNVSPYDIRQLLQGSAGKFSTLGNAHNFVGGNGFVQADSAIKNIANARPIIKKWEPASAALIPNGKDAFPIKITGAYLTNTSQIYFSGQALTNTVVSNDKTEATGMIPAFSTNTDPAIQLRNAPKTTSGLDGGTSEEIRFFTTKKEVLVRAINQSRKYGQANPALTFEILIDGLPITQTTTTLADLKLDGSNLNIATNATANSPVGLYGIFASRATPLDNTTAVDAAIISSYNFTFASATLSVGKMNLKITPNNKTIKYGDYIGEVTYNYELDQTQPGVPDILDQIKQLHKKYIADNALAVVQGFNQQQSFTTGDLVNMSAMASFQAMSNARKFSINNGQLQPIVNGIADNQFADQRFLVDVDAQSLVNYKSNPAESPLVSGYGGEGNDRAVLNVKSLANGVAKSGFTNGQLQPIVNGQLMAMVNGQLRALVNGQLRALVNGATAIDGVADDYVFENGQLRALVNGEWIAITSGQLKAIVNGIEYTIDLSVTNGQLQALVNGQLMPLVNGQLQTIVNGQLLAIVNGQLQALVNGQLMPIVNGQLLAMVNGQLQPIVNGQLMALVNGQLMALVNGQLMALVNGQLENLSNLTQLTNGQLQALVNGQLQPIVNGQLKAMVNGLATDIPTANVTLLNGQLQAMVNGQLQALVNGQLRPLVNGQLLPIVNELEKAGELQFLNGQLRAIVNGQLLPIVNGQLRAMVNGQLQPIVNADISLVNGQLRAMVNGQLQALVNGQLRPLVNGQLQPIVNGDLQPVTRVEQISNGQLRAIVNSNSIPIANGQLQAIVNGQLMPLVNGQLMALVNGELTFAVISNGQLKALVNRQLQPIVNQDGAIPNGQLQALVNGQLQPLVNASITNGQLRALVNSASGPEYTLLNGQLRPLVNGQLQPLVNNFSVSGATNNTNTIAIIDGDDINVQGGSLGGMFAVNMITGLNVGTQKLIPGAFVDDNYDVSYGLGDVVITKRALVITAENKIKVYGDNNPNLTMTGAGFAYGETLNNISLPAISTTVNTVTPIGVYPITLTGGSSLNYDLILQNGNLTVNRRDLLITIGNASKVYGDQNPAFTYIPTGFVNNDTRETAITTQPTIGSNATNTSGVGTYDIVGQGGVATNYNLVFVNGTLTITGLAPTINCPANITVNNTPGQCGANVNFAATETTGNPASSITYSQAPGSLFPVGSTIVTATATNALGNSVCTFTVTVVDIVAPIISCPANISLSLDGSGSNAKISAAIINNNVVVSSTAVPQNPQVGLLAPQNETKTLLGSCDCPTGYGVIGYTGNVGEIVDQFRLICAPINSDGSPGASTTLSCYNGGLSGTAVAPIISPARSWMVGFGIGDKDYYGRSGTLTSIEGYSQTYTDVINLSSTRFTNSKIAGGNIPLLTTVQYAPPGHVLTGMNYYNGWEYSNTVQFKYQPLTTTQELASFPVTDNCSGSLTLAVTGNTTFTSTDIGTSSPLTVQVTDANGNSSTCTSNVTVSGVDNIAPTAICKPVTYNVVSGGTVTVTAASVNNGSTDNSIEPLTYQFLANAAGNNGGQRTTTVNSGARSGRSITGITYTYNGQQNILTPANAIKSTLELSSLTANPTPLPLPAGDANRFWDLSATTMTEPTALRVLGDFDLGTALQDCADPVGVNHKVIFDTPIVPGAGPEIFIVHGGLAFDIQILDINGNVALTIPESVISSGSPITIGGTVVGNIFNAFFLRNKVPYTVEYNPIHVNTQNQVLALDINFSEVPLIGGIRFGGGSCNYVYEILGFQPAPSTASQIVFTSANIGVNPVTLQVTDASGNSSTCISNITVTGSGTSARSSQPATTKTKVKPTQEVVAKEAIYPNPATNTIKLQLGKEVTSANHITLVDAIGRLQSNISIRQLNNKLFELNISNLPKGVYIIRAKTLEGDKTFKFVKM